MEREGRGMSEKVMEIAVSVAVLVAMIITISYMLDMVLLTFLITFIFYNLLQLVQRRNQKYIPLHVPDGLIISILYVLFLLLLAIAIIEIAPVLTQQVMVIASLFKLFDINTVKAVLDPRLAAIVGQMDINTYIYNAGSMIGTWAGTLGSFGLNLFLSILLSYFLLLEKGKIKRFGERMEHSKVAFIYHHLMKFGGNFVHTFAKVMKVQVMIAVINSIISMVLLTFMDFPQIAILGLMIFVLGLIPVAGVVISLIPLSIIAFSIGGINKVIAVILMVVVIHMLEAYVLNPKLMSSKTELPVCFVFMILLVGEHYIGVWGLLIGVPIFIFLMNALEVEYEGMNDQPGEGKEKGDKKIKSDI